MQRRCADFLAPYGNQFSLRFNRVDPFGNPNWPLLPPLTSIPSNLFGRPNSFRNGALPRDYDCIDTRITAGHPSGVENGSRFPGITSQPASLTLPLIHSTDNNVRRHPSVVTRPYGSIFSGPNGAVNFSMLIAPLTVAGPVGSSPEPVNSPDCTIVFQTNDQIHCSPSSKPKIERQRLSDSQTQTDSDEDLSD